MGCYLEKEAKEIRVARTSYQTYLLKKILTASLVSAYKCANLSIRKLLYDFQSTMGQISSLDTPLHDFFGLEIIIK